MEKSIVTNREQSVSKKYLASQSILNNVFNYKVAGTPTKKIPIMIYIAHWHATNNNTKTAIELAKNHLTKLCSQLQRLDIACNPDTRKLLHTSLTKLAMSDIEESVFTLSRSTISSNSSNLDVSHVRLIVIGVHLPTNNKFTCLDNIRTLGAHILYSLRKNTLYNIQLYADPTGFKSMEWFALAEGFIVAMNINAPNVISSNKPNNKTAIEKPSAKSKKSISSKTTEGKVENFYWHVITTASRVSKVGQAIGRAVVTIRSMHMCQDLSNALLHLTPTPNQPMSPLEFISFTQAFIKRDGALGASLSTRVYGPDELNSKGFGLLHYVGSNSSEEGKSRMLVIKYNPVKRLMGASTKSYSKSINSSGISSQLKKTAELILIGRGLVVKDDKDGVFNKSDVTSAAMVLSIILGCAKLGCNKSILAIIPLATYTKPVNTSVNRLKLANGLKSVNGKTVNIDKDMLSSEDMGHLMHAECIGYATSKWPKSMVIDINNGVNCGGEGNYFMEQNIPVKTQGDIMDASKSVGEGMKQIKFGNLEDGVNLDKKRIQKPANIKFSRSAGFLSKFIKSNSNKWLHVNMCGNVKDNVNGINKEDIMNIVANGCIGVRIMLEWLLNY